MTRLSMWLVAAICGSLLSLLVERTTAKSFSPRPISVIANVRGTRHNMTCATVAEVCKKVSEKTGLHLEEQSVLYRGKVLEPTEKLSTAGISVGDTLNIVKRRKEQLTGNKPRDSSKDQLPSEYADMLKKLTQNMNPDSISMAMKALEGAMNGNYIDELFSEDQMEAARVQALKHLDEYDAMIPGMKKQIASIAANPILWKESMVQAKLKMKSILKERKQASSAKNSGMKSENNGTVSENTRPRGPRAEVKSTANIARPGSMRKRDSAK